MLSAPSENVREPRCSDACGYRCALDSQTFLGASRSFLQTSEAPGASKTRCESGNRPLSNSRISRTGVLADEVQDVAACAAAADDRRTRSLTSRSVKTPMPTRVGGGFDIVEDAWPSSSSSGSRKERGVTTRLQPRQPGPR